MSESENDDEEGTNHLSVGHLSNQQISDLCLATRAVQEAFNGKSREELNRRINELNQKWMEVTNAPEHVIRSMQHRLSLPTTSSRSSRRRGNKRKAGNNSNGDDSRKRVANGEEEEAKEAEDDADTRREADKEGDAIDDDLQMVRATRTKLLALRSDGDYESDYAIGRLPSLCSMTSYNLDFIFEDESDDKVDEDIMVVIDGIILVHRIGMEKAQLFRKTASEGVWNSIDCRTMGSLANVLDESTSQETVDSTEYNNVRKAIEYAKKSGDFPLPSNTGINVLAKHFLTVNETTRNYLLVLVHLSAGCSAFLKIDISVLLTGRDPVLSSSVLKTLGYDDDVFPPDMNHLLKSFKLSFDAASIKLDDKVELHEAFSSITAMIGKQPADEWVPIDSSEFDTPSNASTISSQAYFAVDNANGKWRRKRAIFALTGVVTSTLVYEKTCKSENYGDYEGLDQIIYRNSIDYSYRTSMKAINTKAYNGSAGDGYVEGVHKGIRSVIEQANRGSGRGNGRSTFDDDVTILFKLSSIREIDDVLHYFRFDPEKEGVEYSDDDDDDEDDSSSEEEE